MNATSQILYPTALKKQHQAIDKLESEHKAILSLNNGKYAKEKLKLVNVQKNISTT